MRLPTPLVMQTFRSWLATSRKSACAALVALLLTHSAALVHAIDHTPRASMQGAQSGLDERWGHKVDTLTCVVMDHLLAGQQVGSDVGIPQKLPARYRLAPLPVHSVASGPLLRSYQARAPPRA